MFITGNATVQFVSFTQTTSCPYEYHFPSPRVHWHRSLAGEHFCWVQYTHVYEERTNERTISNSTSWTYRYRHTIYYTCRRSYVMCKLEKWYTAIQCRCDGFGSHRRVLQCAIEWRAQANNMFDWLSYRHIDITEHSSLRSQCFCRAFISLRIGCVSVERSVVALYPCHQINCIQSVSWFGTVDVDRVLFVGSVSRARVFWTREREIFLNFKWSIVQLTAWRVVESDKSVKEFETFNEWTLVHLKSALCR